MLKIYGGPMFAGKTTALLTEAKKLPADSFLFFKPSFDDRYQKDAVVSHDGIHLPAVLLDVNKPAFPQIDPKKVQTIFIDELNFFPYQKLKKPLHALLKQGVNVIAGGLIYDYLHQPFGSTLPLSKEADQFIELFARCDNCSKPATHTYRKIQGGGQVLVGAKDSYGAYCQSCWTALQKEKNEVHSQVRQKSQR